MFESGEYVVYGTTGVCEIVEIKQMDNPLTGNPEMYYVMRPVRENAGHLYLPTSNTNVVMRKIMTKEEAEQLIQEMPEIEVLDVPEERKREQRYKEALKTCGSRDCVRVLKTLYLRKMERLASGKKVTALDERYTKIAEKGLFEEMSVSLGIPKEELPECMIAWMEKKD